MAFRIFLDQTVIRIIDETGKNPPIQYNPAEVKYYIKPGGKFVFYDGIEQQNFNNQGYQDFANRDGKLFASEALFIEYLNSFINTTGGTSVSPQTINYDEITENDVDWEASDFTGWVGNPRDLFREVSNGGIYNDSTDSPKSFRIVFKRTKQITVFGIGANTGSFSNPSAILEGSGGFVRGIFDASDDPRPKTSLVYKKEQLEFNALTVLFTTTDRVDVTNIFLKNGQSSRLTDYVNKWGVNPDVDAGQIEDIWDIGGPYTYTTTPQPYYISSSNANDTQEIEVDLLLYDNGFYRQYTALVQLQGQTKVLIPTPNNLDCVASNRAFNNSGTPLVQATPLLGQVYIYEDTAIVAGVPSDLSKVRSSIRVGVEQTQQAVYTVPHFLEDGRQILWAEVIKWRCSLAKKQDSAAVASLICAEPFKMARTRDADAVTDAVPAVGEFGRDTPLVLPPGSDMSVRVAQVTANDSSFGAKFLINLVAF